MITSSRAVFFAVSSRAMNPTTNIAIRAARQAGRLVMRHFQRIDTLNIRKKQLNEYVSDADVMAERAIIETLRQAYPSHAILAEESGSQGQDEYEWIIDPLDGTHNYLHSLPHFAISIALRHRGELQTGVIYDPLHNDMFVGTRGGGALLNDRRLRINHAQALPGALVGSALGNCSTEQRAIYSGLHNAMMQAGVSLRQSGSSALDLAFVAAGYLDGTWQQGIRAWGMAAGILMIREAGGIVTELDGGDNPLNAGNVLAGNRKVHTAMLQHLNPTTIPTTTDQRLHLKRKRT